MHFGKDKMKKMSPIEQKAKMKALEGCHSMASDMLKGKIDGLKKVTVASDSKEGLKKGLEKAESFLGEQSEEDSELSENEVEEASEYEDQQEDSQPMSEEELDAKIQELMRLKEKLQK